MRSDRVYRVRFHLNKVLPINISLTTDQHCVTTRDIIEVFLETVKSRERRTFLSWLTRSPRMVKQPARYLLLRYAHIANLYASTGSLKRKIKRFLLKSKAKRSKVLIIVTDRICTNVMFANWIKNREFVTDKIRRPKEGIRHALLLFASIRLSGKSHRFIKK